MQTNIISSDLFLFFASFSLCTHAETDNANHNLQIYQPQINHII